MNMRFALGIRHEFLGMLCLWVFYNVIVGRIEGMEVMDRFGRTRSIPVCLVTEKPNPLLTITTMYVLRMPNQTLNSTSVC